jgi:hypothetical protein
MKKLFFLILMNPYIPLAQQKSDNHDYFSEIARVYFKDAGDPIPILSKFLYHKTDKDTAYQINFRVWEDGHYDKHFGAITFFGKNKIKDFLNLLKIMQIKHDLNEKHLIKQPSDVILTIFWEGKELVVQTSQFGKIFWSMNCSKSTIDKLNGF